MASITTDTIKVKWLEDGNFEILPNPAKIFGIPVDNTEDMEKILNKYKVFPLEVCGKKFISYLDERGYPRERKTKRLVHRIVAKELIYDLNEHRYIFTFDSYDVHHWDENKLNAEPFNLMILTREEHEKIHKPIFSDDIMYR